ncbi:MAG: DUF4386 domain-containing protein [Gemmatimonadota bacterium]
MPGSWGSCLRLRLRRRARRARGTGAPGRQRPNPTDTVALRVHLVQTCVLAVNKLSLVGVPSILASNVGPTSDVLNKSLALVAVNLHSYGFDIGLIFFGCACLIRGYLIIHSGFVPRALGVLVVLAGAGYLVNSFALLVYPPLAAALFPAILLPALVGELALSICLLLTNQRSLEQALTRAASTVPA